MYRSELISTPEMDFHSMKRNELQALCKKHNIPANLKNVEMANRLASLLKIGDEKPQEQRLKPCLKTIDADSTKEGKKVRISQLNQTFEFDKTNPRALRLAYRTRKSMAMIEDKINYEEKVSAVEDPVPCQEKASKKVSVEKQVKSTRTRGRKPKQADVVEAELLPKKKAEEIDVSKKTASDAKPVMRRSARNAEKPVDSVEQVEIVKVSKRKIRSDCLDNEGDEIAPGRNLRRNTRKETAEKATEEAKDEGKKNAMVTCNNRRQTRGIWSNGTVLATESASVALKRDMVKPEEMTDKKSEAEVQENGVLLRSKQSRKEWKPTDPGKTTVRRKCVGKSKISTIQQAEDLEIDPLANSVESVDISEAADIQNMVCNEIIENEDDEGENQRLDQTTIAAEMEVECIEEEILNGLHRSADTPSTDTMVSNERVDSQTAGENTGHIQDKEEVTQKIKTSESNDICISGRSNDPTECEKSHNRILAEESSSQTIHDETNGIATENKSIVINNESALTNTTDAQVSDYHEDAVLADQNLEVNEEKGGNSVGNILDLEKAIPRETVDKVTKEIDTFLSDHSDDTANCEGSQKQGLEEPVLQLISGEETYGIASLFHSEYAEDDIVESNTGLNGWNSKEDSDELNCNLNDAVLADPNMEVYEEKGKSISPSPAYNSGSEMELDSDLKKLGEFYSPSYNDNLPPQQSAMVLNDASIDEARQSEHQHFTEMYSWSTQPISQISEDEPRKQVDDVALNVHFLFSSQNEQADDSNIMTQEDSEKVASSFKDIFATASGATQDGVTANSKPEPEDDPMDCEDLHGSNAKNKAAAVVLQVSEDKSVIQSSVEEANVTDEDANYRGSISNADSANQTEPENDLIGLVVLMVNAKQTKERGSGEDLSLTSEPQDEYGEIFSLAPKPEESHGEKFSLPEPKEDATMHVYNDNLAPRQSVGQSDQQQNLAEMSSVSIEPITLQGCAHVSHTEPDSLTPKPQEGNGKFSLSPLKPEEANGATLSLSEPVETEPVEAYRENVTDGNDAENDCALINNEPDLMNMTVGNGKFSLSTLKPEEANGATLSLSEPVETEPEEAYRENITDGNDAENDCALINNEPELMNMTVGNGKFSLSPLKPEEANGATLSLSEPVDTEPEEAYRENITDGNATENDCALINNESELMNMTDGNGKFSLSSLKPEEANGATLSLSEPVETEPNKAYGENITDGNATENDCALINNEPEDMNMTEGSGKFSLSPLKPEEANGATLSLSEPVETEPEEAYRENVTDGNDAENDCALINNEPDLMNMTVVNGKFSLSPLKPEEANGATLSLSEPVETEPNDAYRENITYGNATENDCALINNEPEVMNMTDGNGKFSLSPLKPEEANGATLSLSEPVETEPNEAYRENISDGNATENDCALINNEPELMNITDAQLNDNHEDAILGDQNLNGTADFEGSHKRGHGEANPELASAVDTYDIETFFQSEYAEDDITVINNGLEVRNLMEVSHAELNNNHEETGLANQNLKVHHQKADNYVGNIQEAEEVMPIAKCERSHKQELDGANSKLKSYEEIYGQSCSEAHEAVYMEEAALTGVQENSTPSYYSHTEMELVSGVKKRGEFHSASYNVNLALQQGAMALSDDAGHSDQQQHSSEMCRVSTEPITMQGFGRMSRTEPDSLTPEPEKGDSVAHPEPEEGEGEKFAQPESEEANAGNLLLAPKPEESIGEKLSLEESSMDVMTENKAITERKPAKNPSGNGAEVFSLSKNPNSAMNTKKRRILIHGTPSRPIKTADMKENNDSQLKRARHQGDATALRPADRRKALGELPRI